MVKSTSARPKVFPARIHGGEKIVSLGDQHPFVEMCAGREDLCDLAFDELAGPGVFELVADGDFASGLEQPADVGVRGVMRQTAHRHAVARGERKVEDLRAGLGVLEKHLVEITEPEQQQRVLGQFAFDAAILRHHRRELGFGAGHRPKLGGISSSRNEIFALPRSARSAVNISHLTAGRNWVNEQDH